MSHEGEGCDCAAVSQETTSGFFFLTSARSCVWRRFVKAIRYPVILVPSPVCGPFFVYLCPMAIVSWVKTWFGVESTTIVQALAGELNSSRSSLAPISGKLSSEAFGYRSLICCIKHVFLWGILTVIAVRQHRDYLHVVSGYPKASGSLFMGGIRLSSLKRRTNAATLRSA